MSKEEYSQIYSRFDIDSFEADKMSVEVLGKVIEGQLSNEIANFIVANRDRLPVRYSKNHNVKTSVMEYKLDMIIIDRDELNRLKEIEKQHNGW